MEMIKTTCDLEFIKSWMDEEGNKFTAYENLKADKDGKSLWTIYFQKEGKKRRTLATRCTWETVMRRREALLGE